MANTSELLGTWKMLSWKREVVATGETSDAMGADPIGYLSYDGDGRVTAVVVKRDRPKLKGAVPTDDEKAALFDTMLAYAGSYRLEDGRIIHHLDASWNPAWGMSELIRPFVVEGDKLVIYGAPAIDPRTGEEVTYHLEFRRM
ncbi:lipocalin-like domain-containing protein [Ensifer sp. 2YAB10]|uniref:lipocalin-like domain-containing protein n=1 Tax=unclassified Ensifer TaxID=2633371 RepID=UPI000DE3E399